MSPEIGMLVEGKVTKIAPYGAFVQLDDKTSGMVHISEISDSFVRDIGEFLSVGQTVRVKIIKIDDAGRLSLSIKQAEPKPRPAVGRVVEAPAQFESKRADGGSFEDMMSRFMSQSKDKISDLKQRGVTDQPRARRRGKD